MANEFVARNGIIALNNSIVSGSLDVTTNVTSPSFTGSLYGTASWAESASYVQNAESASYVQNAQSASYVLNAISASFSSTASFVENAESASFASTASYAQNAQSASYALNAESASFANTSSFALSASWAPVNNPFPFIGTAEITGSLLINTGSLNINVAQKLIDLEADIIAFAVAL
jgi:hypothetical protein